MTEGTSIVGAMRDILCETEDRRARSPRGSWCTPELGCEWRFGPAAYTALADELRRDHRWPSAGDPLSLNVGGVPVRRDEALAPDAFYLKEP